MNHWHRNALQVVLWILLAASLSHAQFCRHAGVCVIQSISVQSLDTPDTGTDTGTRILTRTYNASYKPVMMRRLPTCVGFDWHYEVNIGDVTAGSSACRVRIIIRRDQGLVIHTCRLFPLFCTQSDFVIQRGMIMINRGQSLGS